MIATYLFAVLIVKASGGALQRGQTASPQLSQALQSNDWRAREEAVAIASERPAGSLDSETVKALAAELTDVTELMVRKGKGILPPDTNGVDIPDYWQALRELLAREHNPLAIDALVGSVSAGGGPYTAVRAFGELAIPSLVATARSDGGLLGQVHTALDIMEQMLETPEIAKTLSTNSRAAIHEVATERFKRPGPRIGWQVLASAAYLGVATGDPELRAAAAFLVDNPTALQAKGVTDPRTVAFYSDRIRQALAKFPAR